ncbi:hypothetical protein WICPIJ_006531 [Wickerhamomyces pijperi]|uniref:Acyl-protein thioesterase 1 n=1 Tax=Wickerhamomyces pijperi TaxID=599730 RepID=A0A9P8TKS7_WICPI|nr:hypothetical protein WICPIJ_006531 [Wickerhamomyces pijperi]
MSPSISAVRVPSKSEKPTAAVIFVHGLGDSGQGWKSISEHARKSPEFDHISFIFPNAPVIPLTVRGGAKMSAWFDIHQFGGVGDKHDYDGYLKSVKAVEALVKEQIRLGVPAERIIIGGFSQGAAVTLGSLATLDTKIGGFLPFSAPVTQFLDVIGSEERHSKANLNTPVFHGQRTSDPVVQKQAGDRASDFFTKHLGYKNYTYKVYPGLAHSVNNEEFMEIFDMIRKVAPSN